jgi:hypothetical protein
MPPTHSTSRVLSTTGPSRRRAFAAAGLAAIVAVAIVKIHLKISGCFRSLITTRAYCRIHSYLITIRLNAVPPMQAIRNALAGHAWTPLRALTPA